MLVCIRECMCWWVVCMAMICSTVSLYWKRWGGCVCVCVCVCVWHLICSLSCILSLSLSLSYISLTPYLSLFLSIFRLSIFLTLPLSPYLSLSLSQLPPYLAPVVPLLTHEGLKSHHVPEPCCVTAKLTRFTLSIYIYTVFIYIHPCR